MFLFIVNLNTNSWFLLLMQHPPVFISHLLRPVSSAACVSRVPQGPARSRHPALAQSWSQHLLEARAYPSATSWPLSCSSGAGTGDSSARTRRRTQGCHTTCSRRHARCNQEGCSRNPVVLYVRVRSHLFVTSGLALPPGADVQIIS